MLPCIVDEKEELTTLVVGIGRGLVTHLLTRPSTTVIAATRSPSSPTSQSLLTLPKDPSSSLILVKLDSSSESDAIEAVKELQSQHSIQKLDVVIANSGVYPPIVPALELSIKTIKDTFNVNTFGPLLLFQATHGLLMKAGKPKFVVVSSGMGSVTNAESWEALMTAYGSSKAAVNFIVRRIHMENPGLITFPICPGWVQTDMGNGGARDAGLEKAPLTIDESVTGILKQVRKLFSCSRRY